MTDIGALYVEDAIEALRLAGYGVGRVEFTMPPRDRRRLADTGGLPSREDMLASSRTYRVVRCAVKDGGVCDLLLTPAAEREPTGAE